MARCSHSKLEGQYACMCHPIVNLVVFLLMMLKTHSSSASKVITVFDNLNWPASTNHRLPYMTRDLNSSKRYLYVDQSPQTLASLLLSILLMKSTR